MSDDRRAFLKQSTVGAVAATALSAATYRRAHGANDRVRLALIGSGGRGTGVAREFHRLDGVDVVYACDPDDGRRNNAVKPMSNQPMPLADFRAALDDKSVDGVIVATPDHWHAPASILAADAGKNVYVEKPCSHNVREGRLLVDAASRNKVKIQHGTQSRSTEFIAKSIALLREGIIGKVLVAKAWNVQQRGEIGHAEPTNPPDNFDYDMWVGPAPMVPFQSNRHHYTWHWWYNFGTGDMGNDGVHELDIARWGLGVNTHPSLVSGTGGKFDFDDDQEFPDTQFVNFDYPGDGKVGNRRQLVFEMRLWSRYGLEGRIDNGNAFYGTDGWMLLTKRGKVEVYDAQNRRKSFPGSDDKPSTGHSHFENFVAAIRGEQKLNAEVEVGHLSATLCHLGNVCARVGRSLQFDPEREVILDDDQANRLVSREYRKGGHWAIPNGVS